MTRLLEVALALSALLLSIAPGRAQEAFRYHAPGDLKVGSGRVDDRTIYLPQMLFPLQAGPAFGGAHAFANSQIHPVGGPGNARDNYAYPWRDTYCEARQWDMPLCPGKTGHQGLDIRPAAPTANSFPAFAMDDGVVTSVTNNTTVTVRSNANYYCRYLHMDRGSIAQAGIKTGSVVRRGDTLGRVSNIMGGTPNTTIHLHFDCYKSINGKIVRLPLFTSLVVAYRRAWGLDPLDQGGRLGVDPIREVGAAVTVGVSGGAAVDTMLPKSIRTKNFGAITPQTERADWPAYILNWPDLMKTVEIRDAFGKIIPAFATNEAGAGLWWYWMVRRAGFGVDGVVSFEKVALKYSGASSVADTVVDKYVAAYSGSAEKPGLSKQYFGRFVDRKEPLALSDADVRWKIAQTMFHNEAGRSDSVDRATFERGVILANAILAGNSVPVTSTSPPPNVTTPTIPTPTQSAPMVSGGAMSTGGTIEVVVGRYIVRVVPNSDLAFLSGVLDLLEKRQ